MKKLLIATAIISTMLSQSAFAVTEVVTPHVSVIETAHITEVVPVKTTSAKTVTASKTTKNVSHETTAAKDTTTDQPTLYTRVKNWFMHPKPTAVVPVVTDACKETKTDSCKKNK